MAWERLDPRAALELMQGYDGWWAVGGGWALDLFLGRTTREHDDLDVVVRRDEQRRLYWHFRGWELAVAHEGTLRPWRGGRLEPPVHSIWSGRERRLAGTSSFW